MADAYNRQQVEQYIRDAARARGIDPNTAVRVARSEGLAPGVWQSNAYKAGVREPSYGPFQLLVGGPGTGFPRGLGNVFKRATGLNPKNKSTIFAQIDFALNEAARRGWGQWYGAARVGIGKWTGLRGAQPAPINPEAVSIAQAPLPKDGPLPTPKPPILPDTAPIPAGLPTPFSASTPDPARFGREQSPMAAGPIDPARFGMLPIAHHIPSRFPASAPVPTAAPRPSQAPSMVASRPPLRMAPGPVDPARFGRTPTGPIAQQSSRAAFQPSPPVAAGFMPPSRPALVAPVPAPSKGARVGTGPVSAPPLPARFAPPAPPTPAPRMAPGPVDPARFGQVAINPTPAPVDRSVVPSNPGQLGGITMSNPVGLGGPGGLMLPLTKPGIVAPPVTPPAAVAPVAPPVAPPPATVAPLPPPRQIIDRPVYREPTPLPPPAFSPMDVYRGIAPQAMSASGNMVSRDPVTGNIAVTNKFGATTIQTPNGQAFGSVGIAGPLGNAPQKDEEEGSRFGFGGMKTIGGGLMGARAGLMLGGLPGAAIGALAGGLLGRELSKPGKGILGGLLGGDDPFRGGSVATVPVYGGGTYTGRFPAAPEPLSAAESRTLMQRYGGNNSGGISQSARDAISRGGPGLY